MRPGIFSTVLRPKAECRPRARAAKRQWQRSRHAQLRRQPIEEEPRKTGDRYGGAAGKTYQAMKGCAQVDRAVPCSMLIRRGQKPPHFSIARGAANPPRSARNLASVARVVFGMTIVCFSRTSDAITLDEVLNSTLGKNPAIQQAKANLERAAGRRLVLRSIVWPNLKLNVPA